MVAKCLRKEVTLLVLWASVDELKKVAVSETPSATLYY